jgi:hypothetical protein
VFVAVNVDWNGNRKTVLRSKAELKVAECQKCRNKTENVEYTT